MKTTTRASLLLAAMMAVSGFAVAQTAAPMSAPDGTPGASTPKMGATSGKSDKAKTPVTQRKGTGGVGTTGTAGSAPDGRPGASSPKMGATSGMSTEMKTPTTQRMGTTPGGAPDGKPGASTEQPKK